MDSSGNGQEKAPVRGMVRIPPATTLDQAVGMMAGMAHGPRTLVVPGMQTAISGLAVTFVCAQGCRHVFEWAATSQGPVWVTTIPEAPTGPVVVEVDDVKL